YAYDVAGNRTQVRVWRKPVTTQPAEDNTRSYKYTYDALQRLIQADFGTLDGGDIVQGGSLRSQWLLDLLGNWSGGNAAGGSYIETGFSGGGGVSFQRSRHDLIDFANEIQAIYQNGQVAVTPRYDPVGNLVCDGTFVYQYDGFNRLI